MKKFLSIFCLIVLTLSLTAGLSGCGKEEQTAKIHKIGVVVYDISDEQVMAFREYLEQYIALSFQDVSFLYSQSISTAEEEMSFIGSCIDEGVEGIMAFNSYDLEAEVDLCSKNNVYYLRPSATVAAEDFAKVEDNPYFIGYFGPGEEMEYKAGEDMAAWFAGQGYGDDYLILSGGAPMGNAMHIQRTMGMLDALAAKYGVNFDQNTAEMAAVSEPKTFSAGNLTVTICGGYVAIDPFYTQAKKVLSENTYSVVLSTIPVGSIAGELKDSKFGLIDCYSQANAELFNTGKLQYVCGKFSSIIGPAFASMYNAVTGHAEEFRQDGKAFKVIQGFWVSDSAADYQKKLELSNGIAINAYAIDDLLHVIKEADETASMESLKDLANAWDFDSAISRRK